MLSVLLSAACLLASLAGCVTTIPDAGVGSDGQSQPLVQTDPSDHTNDLADTTASTTDTPLGDTESDGRDSEASTQESRGDAADVGENAESGEAPTDTETDATTSATETQDPLDVTIQPLPEDSIQAPTETTQGGTNGTGDSDDSDSTGSTSGGTPNTVGDLTITCLSGTPDAYTLAGDTLTFAGITEDSVYSVSGAHAGILVIDAGDTYRFELEMNGFSLTADTQNPVTIQSGDKVTLTAKRGSVNTITDNRAAVSATDTTAKSGAIHSEVDLQVGGRGQLTVTSAHNNGIHSKKDLDVQNLTLNVTAQDNPLKGNDSVTVEGGTITLVSVGGDGIKTTNSDISTQGNQRGTITITGGAILHIYAACDGMDAAYNVVIEEDLAGNAPEVKIHTADYSDYSGDVEDDSQTAASDHYIRYSNNTYSFSVKYWNSDSDYIWVNATFHSQVSSGRSTYYYYSFPQKPAYAKMKVYMYASGQTQGQETSYYWATSDYITPNTQNDTYALSRRGNSISASWTNYSASTTPGGGGFPGGGGMMDGNQNKLDYSAKGIKACNEILITGGHITVEAGDDALHANNTRTLDDGSTSSTLENGETALGNITISGGALILSSDDDGIHADGMVSVSGGDVSVKKSYEGVEGMLIAVSGGTLSITASDDGMNSPATSGTGVKLSGGFVFISCSGDGIDSNSRTSYAGISFEGSEVIIVSNSGGNSAIDTDGGYAYTAGSVVAIMPSGGMSSEATHCQNFNNVGSTSNRSFSQGATVTVSGDMDRTFTMPYSISNALLILLNKNNTVS